MTELSPYITIYDFLGCRCFFSRDQPSQFLIVGGKSPKLRIVVALRYFFVTASTENVSGGFSG